MGYKELTETMKKEHQALMEAREKEQILETKEKNQTSVSMEPVLPTYNPLQETPVSISVQQESLQSVLYVIARNAGLNLVVEPGVSLNKRVTISFEKTPSSVVIDKLLHAFDLSWSVDDNCLYVQRFEEKTFDLDFLNSNTSATIKSGGDIFGNTGILGTTSTTSQEDNLESATAGTGRSQGNDLTGEFSMDTTLGKGVKGDSLYSFLQKNVQDILKSEAGKKGHMVLDSVSGSLYVKTSPRKMKAVTDLVHKLKKKLSQQVVIDAQILEVRLQESFSLGIDWSYVARTLINDYSLEFPMGWIPGEDAGLGTFTFGDNNNPVQTPIIINQDPDEAAFNTSDQFQSTIQALQTFGDVKTISNPHVRARHAEPALVTSGTTLNYIREVTRQEERNNDGDVIFSTRTAAAFEGVMLGVVPYITEKHSVDLKIFPVSSEVDLSNEVSVGDTQITLPRVDIRNVNTIARVNDGDTIILGGLIDKAQEKDDSEAPGLGRVPGLGWLFKSRRTSSDMRELVIIMHVRVI